MSAPNDLTRSAVEPAVTESNLAATTGSYPLASTDDPTTPGLLAGRYALGEVLGEGGMGTVYRAQQVHPVKRSVAVKLIKSGMDSARVVARFEAERQALALMDHPHIAKVFDAGTTDRGQPFFVMELVNGVPLTAYCDENRLTVRQRLDLFVHVCQAVQHAHQKGIMHRDIKPSNILVVEVDGKPMPKVIDFGLAKALLAGAIPDASLETAFGSVLGTPLYMAPEQADTGTVDVDTRADIYSLGVILYELLVGSTPVTRDTLKNAAIGEMLRRVREIETPAPTARLKAAPDLPNIAAGRSTEPARLAREIRGDLEWIALKCLEKDRSRRYETANGLATDVLHYLANEPVSAGPPGRWYKVRKFARRHRVGLSVASAFAGLLVVSAAVAIWLAVRAAGAEALARTEAAKAEAAKSRTRAALDEVSSEAIETLLTQQRELTDQHKSFLRRTLELYADFADEPGAAPETRAAVARAYLRMGDIRLRLGELSEARTACERAVAGLAPLASEFPESPAYRSDLAKAHDTLGQVLVRQVDRAAAEQQFGTAVALYEALHGLQPGGTKFLGRLAKVSVSLANLLADRRAQQDAESGYRRAIRLLIDLPPDAADRDSRAILVSARYNLALLLHEMDRPADAKEEYLRAIAVSEKLVADYPQAHDSVRLLSSCLINLSELMGELKAWDEAEALHRRGLEIQDRLVRDFPAIPEYRKYLGRTLGSLASLLEQRNKPNDARTMYRRAVEVKEQLARQYPSFPDYRRDLGSIHNNFAYFELEQGRLAQAETGFRAALAVQEPLVREHPTVPEYRLEIGNSYGNLGTVLRRSKAFEAAETAFRQVLEQDETLLGQFPNDPSYLSRKGADEGNIAMILADRGKKKESLVWFDRSLDHLKTALAQMPRPSSQGLEWLVTTTAGLADAREALGQEQAVLAAIDATLTIAANRVDDPAVAAGMYALQVRACQWRGGMNCVEPKA